MYSLKQTENDANHSKERSLLRTKFGVVTAGLQVNLSFFLIYNRNLITNKYNKKTSYCQKNSHFAKKNIYLTKKLDIFPRKVY